ncbi:MAG: hypothetical protein J6Y25_06505 [Elusimicrobiaceae bacterium]|nr:hypothetical protein [Elusimicrobiaceae bacterium]MBP5617037.1 hypothetical protein [Elusimicrobiaceae bacterium]
MFVEQAIQTCYRRTTPAGILYELEENFPAFKGHFEGYPLLPAVCQISFCSDAASRLLNKPMEVKAIKKAKFISPSLPGSFIEVKLSQRPDGWYFAELVEPNQNKKLSQLIVQFVQREL